MTDETFLKPRLIGSRFEGHAIPLEFLRDLAVLEPMIIEVAKRQYLKAHPERKRIPRGFLKGTELRLVDVEDGSARPVIGLFLTAAASFMPPANQIYFERARDEIIYAIAAAERSEVVTAQFPEQALGYFDVLGRSLRADEAIEFRIPGNENSAKLTLESRRRLILASTTASNFTEEATVRGLIPEADQKNMTFELELPDGRRVNAPITPQHLEVVLEGFVGYKRLALLVIQGIGRFSRQGKLEEFDSIEQAAILDPLDVGARMDELSLLKDGWLEGKGIAPRQEGLKWLGLTFELYFPDDLPLPRLFPTAEGGVMAEWEFDQNEISLEVDLSDHLGAWHRLNTKQYQEEERLLDLQLKEEWTWLAQQIRSMAGDAA